MLTTETYSRAFWNSMRSKNTDGSILEEAANLANGSYFLPEASADEYAAALAKENLFRRMATLKLRRTHSSMAMALASPRASCTPQRARMLA